ncbi:hypothetical protein E9993_13345 [Labilibacter sediminis]|nr:hypothetical protein E9993_13345 [Labilibacter sediminis]
MDIDLTNIEDIRSVSFQIFILLFCAVVVYLYVNFRFNRRKIGRRKFALNAKFNADEVNGERFIAQFELFNSIPIPLCRISLRGKVEVFNKAFLQLISLKGADIKDKIINDIIDNETFKSVYSENELQSLPKSSLVELAGEQYKVKFNLIGESDFDTPYVLLLFEKWSEEQKVD